jgi:hypothetical protein
MAFWAGSRPDGRSAARIERLGFENDVLHGRNELPAGMGK